MTVYDINEAAADYIDAHGWTQGAERDNQGRVCLTGALSVCAPQPGDFYVARAVNRAKGHGEQWNDNKSRTADQVTDYLRSSPITDADLEATFGPNWADVVALVRRAAVLTDAEVSDFSAAGRNAAWAADRNAARNAAWAADRGAARAAARNAAWDATWNATRGATWNAARDAVWDATWAVCVRDLITTEQFDTLTAPWVAVIGATWDAAS